MASLDSTVFALTIGALVKGLEGHRVRRERHLKELLRAVCTAHARHAVSCHHEPTMIMSCIFCARCLLSLAGFPHAREQGARTSKKE